MNLTDIKMARYWIHHVLTKFKIEDPNMIRLQNLNEITKFELQDINIIYEHTIVYFSNINRINLIKKT